jgi:hypothetical protein
VAVVGVGVVAGVVATPPGGAGGCCRAR